MTSTDTNLLGAESLPQQTRLSSGALAPLTPAEIGSALAVIGLGGIPAELASACRQQAPLHEGEPRTRLLRAARALDFAAAAVAAMGAELAGHSIDE